MPLPPKKLMEKQTFLAPPHLPQLCTTAANVLHKRSHCRIRSYYNSNLLCKSTLVVWKFQ